MKSVFRSRSMNKNPDSLYRVRFGLDYLRPNPLPHFSVTVTAPEYLDVATGCAHGDVLAQYPDLADIVALHGSSVTGVPMYALANAWYWWSDYDGRGTHHVRNRLDVLADHLRVSREEVDALDLPRVRMAGDEYPAEFVAYVDAQRERWRHEADAVIDKYGLHGWDQ